MAVLEPYKGGYYLWQYLPSVPAAAIFCLLFFAATCAHAWRVYKTRIWFALPFVIGGFMEVIGYATRALAHYNTGKLMPYVIQNTMILLAPVLFAASIYMALKKIIHNVHGEKHSIIRPTWLTRLFVTGDVMSLMVQGGAAGLMVISSMASLGQKIVVAGLIMQIIMFGLFWATAAFFHIRMRGDPSVVYIPADVKWQEALFMLYGVSALIMLRSIFRVVEFVMGNDGYALSNEWTLYVFDSSMMWLVMVIFWVWFPQSIKQRHSFQSISSMAVLEPAPGSRGSDAHPTEYMDVQMQMKA